MYRGDYATIAEAVEAANPGDRILIRPGFYQEKIVLNKPLEIIGEGDLEEIVVQAATDSNTLQFKTTMGRVANLTMQKHRYSVLRNDRTRSSGIGEVRHLQPRPLLRHHRQWC